MTTTTTTRLRPDKRQSAHELRPFYCSSALLSRADGSVRFKFGDTAVLCSVFGPMEVKIRDEKLDKATVEVIVKTASGQTSTTEMLYGAMIRQTVEASILAALHPRTLIRIVLQVLTDDGGIIPSAVNAATLALIDAGIPLRAVPAGVTCMIAQDGVLLLDPSLVELESAKSIHTFVFDNASDGAMATLCTGSFTENEFDNAYNMALSAVTTVHQLMRSTIEGRIVREHGAIADGDEA
ncbi:ribosomal protein S5 domain 2-type protein [Fimicolochytrium jonesii]|uniref:ribosomal protein S5 domain 2-type protein n=1 Tax=Fimicolochytrium jonesii TaxID=1396493 RepID=UPI0022FDCBFC|nr:ribosomal protein S5 domain 2-type protein [Fimicolochytrium jonesii]KAI8817469.1 ribosomal protein S5 domain 2-type protein [Fimicolochytrium jonesii]